jgi:hypothetical protein
MRKWFIAGLAVMFSTGAWASFVPEPNYISMWGGFIYNHGFINPDDLGLTFTNEGIRDVTISAGQLSGVDPETGAVITNSANLLSLKAQSLTTVSNVTAGGKFIGDGSGLTNLNVNSLTGRISTASLPISGVWNAAGLTVSNLTVSGANVSGNVAAMTNLTLNGETLGGVITNLQQQVENGRFVQQGGAAQLSSLVVGSGLSSFASISGSSAGDYAGEYYFAGTDGYYGDFYTNTVGKFLSADVDYSYGGSWLLGYSIGGFTFCTDGFGWFDISWQSVDISAEYYSVARSVTIANGNITADGKLTASEIKTTGNVKITTDNTNKRVVITSGSGITISDAGYTTYIMAMNENWGTINDQNSWGSSLFELVRYGGTIDIGNLYFSQALIAGNANGHVYIGEKVDCNGFVGSFSASNGNTLDMQHVYGAVGLFASEKGSYKLIVTNSSAIVAAVKANSGNTYIQGTNLLIVGDNIKISNKSNVGIVGQGVTAFKSDAMYAGSFVAGSGNGACSTNNRFYFGSNSWLFASGTNLLFRDSAGNTISLRNPGTGASATWGSITGTLSSQSDLASALATKANSSGLSTVATSGNYADLTGRPALAPIATNANFSNLTVADGAIAQAKVNGLTNTYMTVAASTNYVSTAQFSAGTSNLLNKTAASNSLTGVLTLQTNLLAQGKVIVGSPAFAQQTVSNATTGALIVDGVIRGDGSGLTQLNATNLVGMISANNLPPEALQPGYSDADAVAAVNAAYPNLGSAVSASDVVAIVSSNGFATTSQLAALTAEDVGAYTTNQTDQAISNALSGIQVSGYVATNHVGDVSINGTLTLQTNLLAQGKVIVGSPAFAQQTVSNAVTGALIVDGVIHGDGSGLVQLNATNLVGTISTNNLPPEALQSGYSDVDAVAAVNAAYPNLGAGISASEVVAIVSSNGFAVATEVHGLISEVSNRVAALTAADVGAYTTNETCAAISAALANSQANGPFISTYIPPQGDLSMGLFTNGLPQ